MFKNLKIIEINANNLNLQENKNLIFSYSTSIAEYVEIFKNKKIRQWQNNYIERNNPDNIINELATNSNDCLLILLDNANFVGGLKLKDTEYQGFWNSKKFENDVIKYITGLVTDPKLKGQGAGQAIMQALGNYARKKGIKKLRLDCRYENKFLVNYYTKHGFKIVSIGYKASTDYKYALCEALPKDINA